MFLMARNSRLQDVTMLEIRIVLPAECQRYQDDSRKEEIDHMETLGDMKPLIRHAKPGLHKRVHSTPFRVNATGTRHPIV